MPCYPLHCRVSVYPGRTLHGNALTADSLFPEIRDLSQAFYQFSQIRSANKCSSCPLTSPYIPVVRNEAWPSQR
jgi:hypothetical protein